MLRWTPELVHPGGSSTERPRRTLPSPSCVAGCLCCALSGYEVTIDIHASLWLRACFFSRHLSALDFQCNMSVAGKDSPCDFNLLKCTKTSFMAKYVVYLVKRPMCT